MSQGLGLVILTFTAKIAGFLRDLVLSYFYGASYIVDAYIIATTIPMVIFSFLGTGIETSLIPVFSKMKQEQRDIDKFTSNIINIFLSVCLIAILLILIFPEFIVRVFAFGFNAETMLIAVSFTRFSILGIGFTTITYIFTSILHYENKFIAAALSVILMDIVVLLFVLLSSKFGIYLLPIGNVAAFAIQSVFLSFFVRKHKYYRIFSFKDKYFKELIRIIIPVIIGTSVNQLNLLIDQTLASSITVGGIAYLNYANKILSVVQGVFILSFISLLFPKMTEMYNNNLLKKLTDKLVQWIISLQFFLMPCTLIFCFYAKDIIRFLLQRGEFSLNDTSNTAQILFIYAVELPFYGLREILCRVYYTKKNTKLPMLNSIIGLLINILISVLLAIKYGLIGLAIGTAVSCIITSFFILYHFLNDFLPHQKLTFLIQIIKSSFIFGSVALTISYPVTKYMNINNENFFIIKVCIIFIIYIFVTIPYLLKHKILILKNKD